MENQAPTEDSLTEIASTKPRFTWDQWPGTLLSLPHYLWKALRSLTWADMRWTYVFLVAMLIGGVLLNMLLPNGWTIWPLIPVLTLVVAVNEATDRSGQGVPPLQVYLFFGGALLSWIVAMMLLSHLSVFVLLIAFAILAYYIFAGWQKQREIERIVAGRRENNQCIHCGEGIDADNPVYCGNCGNEPDPEAASANRTHQIATRTTGKQNQRARTVLKQPSSTGIAQQKEQALLAKRHQKRSRK